MPTTKKENVYFGLMMCCGMVVGMMSYNLVTNGLIGTISWKGILVQFVLCFITAFLVESFIVGPVAKKIAFSLPFDKSKQVPLILSLSFFMVIGMVLIMSMYGLATSYLLNPPVGTSLLESYFSLLVKNVSFALPLQLLIVGPTARYLFKRFVKSEEIAVSAS
ncbi:MULTISPECIES: hypothetical protein [unclassified Paenibacillus]|uniref:hypothetical protein n=1 Tax=unclassified Paenibacillus TaxID=185978 RepID=UPI00020D76E4|nr:MULTISPECIES: hypothetical protein [unclassified Paenibacillus]EGL19248.1 hypothetical protein HMPREF9413_2232 [Paenibacillus sp. HGF7]EPD93635.1 hypothetical protein HMPREF1207_00201 [Paenibacillus sp. HGH0039]